MKSRAPSPIGVLEVTKASRWYTCDHCGVLIEEGEKHVSRVEQAPRRDTLVIVWRAMQRYHKHCAIERINTAARVAVEALSND